MNAGAEGPRGGPKGEPVRIVVPYDLGLLSDNQRLHPFERRRREKACSLAALAGWHDAGKPQFHVPVTVAIHVIRGRVIDDDHVIFAFTAARNILFKRFYHGFGVTHDDSPSWLRQGPVSYETGARFRGCERFELFIAPYED